MEDATKLLDNLPVLRSKLSTDGYILLRNQIPTKLIDDGLQIIAKSLHETWKCIDVDVDVKDERTVDDLYIKGGSTGILLTGYKPITHNKSVLSLLHCDELISVMNKIFGDEAITYDTKWLRVKGKDEYTDEHSDYYRFIDSWNKLLTVWMPLMNIPLSRGPLAVCPRSHLLKFQNQNEIIDYKYEEDPELPNDFNTFNKTAMWKSTNFKKGDLLIFDIRTIHASLVNKTNKFRISIDTRWQPINSIGFWNDSLI
eukprot:895369_1